MVSSPSLPIKVLSLSSPTRVSLADPAMIFSIFFTLSRFDPLIATSASTAPFKVTDRLSLIAE